MPLLTLTTDYGSSSHYVAAIKGRIFSLYPHATIVDISHNIRNFDVLQAAFVLRNAFHDFPEGTVHIIGVDTNINLHKQFLICRHQQQFFLCADNGLINLLFDETPREIWSIRPEHTRPSDLFPDKNLLAEIAVKLMQGTDPATLGNPARPANKSILNHAVTDGNIIRASIVFIDEYQNAFVNVSRTLFEEIGKNRNFKIYYFRRNYIDSISRHYHDVREGDELALFNEYGYLEIAMNHGRASQLLGLKVGGPVIIEFED